MSSIYVLEPPTKGKVVLQTTHGPLDVELWPKEAPKAVRNFVQLCLEGYYDNIIFHRIIKGFLVQGGDPTGFGHKEVTLELMNREYTSDIIKTLKENGFEYTWGNVTVKLAEAYGFCWGVERAVQIAYEARKQFPDDKIWITDEIIHNPTVNKRLEVMQRQWLCNACAVAVPWRQGPRRAC